MERATGLSRRAREERNKWDQMIMGEDVKHPWPPCQSCLTQAETLAHRHPLSQPALSPVNRHEEHACNKTQIYTDIQMEKKQFYSHQIRK